MRTHRPWWNFTQTFGSADPGENGNHTRLISESEQRLQVFAALTWGYTGFLDYYYALTPKWYERGSVPLLVTTDGEATQAYHHHRQIIRETMNLGRGLSQLRHIDAGHWEDRHRILRGLGVEIDKASVTLGRFCDDSGDDSYFMITNTASHADKSASELEQTITLHLTPARDLLRLDRLTGSLVRHELTPGPGDQVATLALALPGGTGTLLKVDTGTPFAFLSE